MGNRMEFHNILKSIAPNVYYQIPTNIMMEYPAIVYERRSIGGLFGSNNIHVNRNSYTVTVIDSNPDSEIVDKIMQLPFCGFERHYVSEGLNHDVFVIYY